MDVEKIAKNSNKLRRLNEIIDSYSVESQDLLLTTTDKQVHSLRIGDEEDSYGLVAKFLAGLKAYYEDSVKEGVNNGQA